MKSKNSFIDLHCHPSLKPYGKSFKFKKTEKQNSLNPTNDYSIWFEQKPKLFKKVLNVFLSLTKWRQSDMSSLVNTTSKVVVISLYPLEKGMVIHRDNADVKLTGKLLRNLATGISMRRIRHLQNMKDYFLDLEDEYNFYKQLHNETVEVDGVEMKYVLVNKASEIDYSAEHTIHVIFSIEGGHVFNCGLQLAGQSKANPTEVIANVNKVKDWDFKPLFIGLAHHFDNELCGFSKSFDGIVSKLIHQYPDENQGITDLGKDVIMELLDNRDNKRILVDLKHMNPKSRYQYYDLLKTEFPNENIPLVVSHGTINGKLHYLTHNKVWKKGFNAAEINFYFDEIQKIERSKGIFGIQLDERRIFDVKTKSKVYKKAKKNMTKYGRPTLRKNSYFVWRQIEYIATYLNTLNRNAWDIQALGTDYDGIINPLNGWWTVDELSFLGDYLTVHAQDFLNSKDAVKLKPQNRLGAKDIINKFMYKNAQDFIERNF